MADATRRLEMERKRRQLAQIKEDKLRQAALAEKERLRRAQLNQGNENSPLGTKSDDPDTILQSLGIPLSSISSSFSTLDQSQLLPNVTSPDVSHLQSQSSHQNDGTSSIFADQSTSIQSSNSTATATARQSNPLQVVHVNQINIPPKERLAYSKSTQTSVSTSPPPEEETAQGDVVPRKSYYDFWSASIPSSEGDSKSVAEEPKSIEQGTEAMSELRNMSEDERKQVELREDYQHFVDRATKILERALHNNESPEIFIHYFPDDGKDATDNDQRSCKRLSLNRIFHDIKWSDGRCVTGFDWSAQYPELLLASYHSSEKTPSEPDGSVLVWNTKFKNTSPEYTFHCQSAIVSSCFAKFHPSLIVGGTYSGQIVLWDMRSNKKTPVQRSSLTTAGHTHPVYCAKVVGTQNSHNLISVSTDGKLCSWSLDMLSTPQDTMELKTPQPVSSVAVTCINFHPDDTNNFLVGSEEGTVYQACRHGQQQGTTRKFDSHQGFITGVDFRPTIDSQPMKSQLFLTSSIDWTVKLWDTNLAQPIHTFESYSDYIYDVKWSPNNPAMFATADGDGRVDIWNMANDCELPIASIHIEPVGRVQPSLNKLIWTPSGNQVVVGDNVGRIHMYDVSDQQ